MLQLKYEQFLTKPSTQKTATMSQLLLVRHGQASFGKADYDQLSVQGGQQATWLGEHFDSISLDADLIVSGSLKRHQQTKANMLSTWSTNVDQKTMPDWNEFDFQQVVASYLSLHPNEKPSKNEPKEFFRLLKDALGAWSRDELSDALPESWLQFRERVARALEETMAHSANRIIVVSSGGTISVALGLVMDLSPEKIIDLNLQTRNTGVSEVFFNKKARYVAGFNSVPHLLHPERKKSITSA